MRRIALLVAAAALAGGSAAGAGVKSHSADVTLIEAVTVSGKTLPAGHYHLTWTGDSSKVHVTFEEGHRVVAKADATVKQRDQASPVEEVISRATESGQSALAELRLRNQKSVLAFPIS
jgi:hypothetical protein